MRPFLLRPVAVQEAQGGSRAQRRRHRRSVHGQIEELLRGSTVPVGQLPQPV